MEHVFHDSIKGILLRVRPGVRHDGAETSPFIQHESESLGCITALPRICCVPRRTDPFPSPQNAIAARLRLPGRECEAEKGQCFGRDVTPS